MTIDEIRDTFRELSGRRNLVDEAVDVYIRSGLRFLDDLAGTQHARARNISTLAIGDYYKVFDSPVKVIERVTLIKDLQIVTHLLPLQIDDLQTYAGDLISSTTQSLPEYFAVAQLRRTPYDTPVTDTGKFAIIETGDSSTYNGVIFNCPVDYPYTIDVKGQFYGELEHNWWIVNYELTVVHSALCKMEVGYRNREGMADWLAAIKLDIDEIQKNLAEQESIGITRMEG